MTVEIQEVGSDWLARYAEIPIAFTVESMLHVRMNGNPLAGFVLEEERVEQPYVKDYDEYEREHPTYWPMRFDLSNWGIFLAREGEEDVGGAVVAYDTPGVMMLKERKNLAVLWDIRVRSDRRGSGVGARLFHYAADWARHRGCIRLKAETQNVNVGACRFYAKQGCTLGAIDRYAYANHPAIEDEFMLLWALEL